MIESAGQIIPEAFISILRLESDISAVDAEVITTDKPVTFITQAGAAETRGLANGREGQIKILINKTYAADTVVTPTALANGTTITFNAAGDCWMGIFHLGEWHTFGGLATGVGANAVVA
jgi:hypothetical protein